MHIYIEQPNICTHHRSTPSPNTLHTHMHDIMVPTSVKFIQFCMSGHEIFMRVNAISSCTRAEKTGWTHLQALFPLNQAVAYIVLSCLLQAHALQPGAFMSI